MYMFTGLPKKKQIQNNTIKENHGQNKREQTNLLARKIFEASNKPSLIIPLQWGTLNTLTRSADLPMVIQTANHIYTYIIKLNIHTGRHAYTDADTFSTFLPMSA